MEGGKRITFHGLQAARFLVVGAANFVVTLAIFYGMLRFFEANYLLSLACAWAIGMLFSYVVNFAWVFKPEERIRFNRRFVRYATAGATSVLLNMAALRLVVDSTGLDPFLAQCALIPLIVGFNYATAKFWSLRKVR